MNKGIRPGLPEGPAFQMRVEWPFVFLVRDPATGMILFEGATVRISPGVVDATAVVVAVGGDERWRVEGKG
ncbi:hypothetical protein PAPYR_6979 [Paratrimastix pyriformis]|uniref:Uncharacterized protein n=1 Tax=Paratrimastix pyriformis TaxID=342808 RepID=A0ABQ8UH52_9EUKA|nr:hypothetical protein PAPYR_6979 [Paratrimastix pyriformis]